MQKCDLCEQPAQYHDVRIVNGKHATQHLCVKHAQQVGIDVSPTDFSTIFQLQGDINIKSCFDCGMTLSQYKEKSLLGCPSCYESFADELYLMIAKVQDNNTQHLGRIPSQAPTNMDRHMLIRKLLKELEIAVHKEDYENAAVLRDQLRELHEQGADDGV